MPSCSPTTSPVTQGAEVLSFKSGLMAHHSRAIHPCHQAAKSPAGSGSCLTASRVGSISHRRSTVNIAFQIPSKYLMQSPDTHVPLSCLLVGLLGNPTVLFHEPCRWLSTRLARCRPQNRTALFLRAVATAPGISTSARKVVQSRYIEMVYKKLLCLHALTFQVSTG